MSTTELDNLAAETAAAYTTVHPDFAVLAARIAVSNLHKNTLKSFSRTARLLYDYIDPVTNTHAPLLSKETYDIIRKNADAIDSSIIYDRDYNFDYFGFKTLERSYLIRTNGKITERPQHLFMRVAIGIHKEDIAAAIETYNLMSEKWFVRRYTYLVQCRNAQTADVVLFSVEYDRGQHRWYFNTLKRCA